MGVRELGKGKRIVKEFPKGSIMMFAGFESGLHNLSRSQNLKNPICPSPETNTKRKE